MATDPLAPVALDASPAQAFASHRARANGIARHYAGSRPLADLNGKAEEDKTFTLLAHLHAVDNDPDFAIPGQEASRTAAPAALRRLNPGDGKVGTHRDYDMALKGLMTIAFRYGHLLGDGGVDFILDRLVPANIAGGHPPDLDVIVDVPVLVEYPETENHLLMIESTRYLANQLRFDQTGDRTFDNQGNGLSSWLLGYMQTIARHDFLEFNSRPYQRLALHPLYNLHEFAREERIRTAAQILLDYTMMKFAVSSNRGRRIGPFRRLQHRIDHQANWRNYHFSPLGDQVAGFFMAYTGYINPQDKPDRFLDSLTSTALISGTAAYRPPPAAYALALDRTNPPALHRFYHGIRPRLRASPDTPEGGLEIYYHSPSFLLSAGGQFLNSGYGRDELDFFKEAWEQTSRAQATTLIPTRADTRFHDLLRFEPYPDPLVDPYADDMDDPDTIRGRAVNIGVHRGLAAGANLRPAEKKTILEHATGTHPTLGVHAGRLLVGWKGSGNDHLNVARVLDTNILGIDGVEGVEEVVTLPDTTDRSLAIASHAGRLVIAWRGSGNKNLNLAVFHAHRNEISGKTTLPEISDHNPALVSHNGRLYLAWTGVGNERLNLATVSLFGNTQGGGGIESVGNKVVLGDTSSAAPTLASHNGRLFIAWKGSGNDQLNLAFSDDGGASFHGKVVFPETSSHGPSLASNGGRLYMAWKGSGNEHLNVARVVLFGNTQGGFGIEGLENKVTLGDISTQPPALGSFNDRVYLAWKGEGADNLNLRVSRDGTFATQEGWRFLNLAHLGFHVAIYRTPVALPELLDPVPDNLAILYAMEAEGMAFETFISSTMERNTHLPPRLDYGSFVEFHAPDGKDYSVWFQLTGQKYQARVVDLGERLGDLATLPLVSGEYLTSVGSHEGLIEIRQPGAERAPVVLDFRNAERPSRQDNREAFPEPWIARTQALVALARTLDERGQRKDAQAALTDAAHLYEELVVLNPDRNGPQLAPAVIQGLALIGVDFSVPEADLRDWLANPQFTPYPALAQALLLLGRRLKAPVFLDVIAFNYEHTPGIASPRHRSDIRMDVLKAAILAGFNIRNGTQLVNPEDVFQAP